MENRIKAPKYVQKHIRIMQKNAKIVNDWMVENNISRSTSLSSLLEPEEKKKKKFIHKNQMNIFDYLSKEDRGTYI